MKSVASLGVIALLAVSCTEAGIQPKDDNTNILVDNLLEVSGEVCASEPGERRFPVKIMFVVDTSGSMQFTDPSDKNQGATQTACVDLCTTSAGLSAAECATRCAGAENPGRRGAVEAVITRFRNNPEVEFAIISYNGRIRVNGDTDADSFKFTRDDTDIEKGLESTMQADITTDYQGALSTAYQILENDMKDGNPVDLGRTKYVILWLSDGAPSPRCKKGCHSCPVGSSCNYERRSCDNGGGSCDQTCPTGTTCNYATGVCDQDADGQPTTSRCGSDRFQICDAPLADIPKGLYSGLLEPCEAYNTDEQIVAKVKEIKELAEAYGVGELRFHTAFLFVDSLPKAIRDLFYDPNLTAEGQKKSAEDLLKKMAVAGDGIYRSFNSGQSIDFLDVNYTSVTRPYGITNFIVTNMNAIPAVNHLQIDSDGDGVADILEFNAMQDFKVSMKDDRVDSDGDGYSDKMEYTLLNAGFDPGDPQKPPRRCAPSERSDDDGDGLLACEEAVLGTHPGIADTDADRIPDGLEFWFGTNPREKDAKADPDFDGKLSDEEIKIHSSPTTVDPTVQADFKYIYDVSELPARPDLRKCYTFKVRRVRLVTTKSRQGIGTTGYNDIMVYFGEGPADDPTDHGKFQVACIRAQYVEPSYKFPASGRITLTPADFHPLEQLKILKEEYATGVSDKDPCVGAPLP
jgi:uncharacterized protein YegL